MSPSSSCFSFETSFTTSPFRTVELLHSGFTRVEDTTYLGRPFSLSAHSPLRPVHRGPKYSSLRRPSSRASAPSASSNSTLAHSSRSLSPTWPNQPPCLKPSSPVGSWTTPSSETFSLITIFPISVLPSESLSATRGVDTAAWGIWAPTNRTVHSSAGVYIRMEVRQGAGRRRRYGGDRRLDLKGAGRGRRRVPAAGRAAPPRAPGAL